MYVCVFVYVNLILYLIVNLTNVNLSKTNFNKFLQHVNLLDIKNENVVIFYVNVNI